jgi:hypothetical protein
MQISFLRKGSVRGKVASFSLRRLRPEAAGQGEVVDAQHETAPAPTASVYPLHHTALSEVADFLAHAVSCGANRGREFRQIKFSERRQRQQMGD